MREGMNNQGYPTEKLLETIENWDPTDFDGLAQLIADNWVYKSYCEYKDGILKLSTGGWSGNEDIVSAINPIWCTLYFEATRRGGHYIFASSKSNCSYQIIDDKELEQLKHDYYIAGYRVGRRGENPKSWSEEEDGGGP